MDTHNFMNPMVAARLPMPSGRNSLQGALSNGVNSSNSKIGPADIATRSVIENNTNISESSSVNGPTSDQDMRGQMEQSLQRSVTLVFWYKPKTEPVRLPMMIPTFPLFQLSHFVTLTSELGLSPTSYLDTYNSQSNTWEQHTISSVRTVEKEQRLLYRVRKSLLEGLNEEECVGLREEMAMQTKPKSMAHVQAYTPVSSIGNISSALKRTAPEPHESAPPNKQHIPEGYNILQRTPAYENSSYTSTTNVSNSGLPSAASSPRTTTPVAQPTSPAPPNPIIASSTSFTSQPNTPYLYQSQPPTFFSSTSYPLTLPQHLVSPTSPAAPIPFHPHPPLKRWPNDYTVIEISHGFHAMDALISQSPNGAPLTQKLAFERVFGSRYVKSTVCRHRGVWRKAHQAIRDEFELIGEDERACWGEFVRRVEGRPPGKVAMAAVPLHESGYLRHGAQGNSGPQTAGNMGLGQARPAQAEENEESSHVHVMGSLQQPPNQNISQANVAVSQNGHLGVFDPALLKTQTTQA